LIVMFRMTPATIAERKRPATNGRQRTTND